MFEILSQQAVDVDKNTKMLLGPTHETHKYMTYFLI